MEPSTISVTFVDDAASATMATLDLPIADLPDTFELETTLHMGNDDWAVVSAQPQTKLEFASSGKLALRLRKIEKVNLSEMKKAVSGGPPRAMASLGPIPACRIQSR
jgi:hypothetical protein